MGRFVHNISHWPESVIFGLGTNFCSIFVNYIFTFLSDLCKQQVYVSYVNTNMCHNITILYINFLWFVFVNWYPIGITYWHVCIFVWVIYMFIVVVSNLRSIWSSDPRQVVCEVKQIYALSIILLNFEINYHNDKKMH